MADFIGWLTSDRVYPCVMGGLGLAVLGAFRLWARRTRLALAVDDPTPDEPDADLMALAEHVDVDPQPTFAVDVSRDRSHTTIVASTGGHVEIVDPPEPTARYVPCAHTWAVDDQQPCGDGDWHACTRIPGGHQLHVCMCGARYEPEQVVLVVDPPAAPAYAAVCDLAWTDEQPCCSYARAGQHVCALIGGHRIHRCGAGDAELDAGAVVPAPLIGAGEPASPQPEAVKWVTFGDARVHKQCMDWRRDGRHELIVDGCRPHLVGAASNLPSGGAT